MSFREDIAALVAANSYGVLANGDGWPRVPLGEVARVINGFAFQSKYFSPDKGTPLVRIRDVVEGASNTRYSGPIPDGYEVQDGDLLVGMDGDFNSAYWRGGPSLLNQRVCRIVPDERRLRLRFLGYLLPAYLELINRHTSSVTVKHLSSRTLQALPLPVPSVEVQDAIVARIDDLFADIDDGELALARTRVDLETYRKALLKAAVLGELTAEWRLANPPIETGHDLLSRILADHRAFWEATPKGQKKRYSEPASPSVHELPALPDGWTWATLQQIAFISGGAAVDQKRKPREPLEVPYLRVANVQRGRLDLGVIKTITIEASSLNGLRLRDGDLLLNEGGDRDKVGRGWVWRSELPVCVHQNHVFKARPATAIVRSELVSAYLNEMGRGFFIDESKQTTNLASISLTKVSLAPVPIPPAAEAAVILDRIREYHPSILDDTIETAAQASVDLRQSILAAAFCGDLVA